MHLCLQKYEKLKFGKAKVKLIMEQKPKNNYPFVQLN